MGNPPGKNICYNGMGNLRLGKEFEYAFYYIHSLQLHGRYLLLVAQ